MSDTIDEEDILFQKNNIDSKINNLTNSYFESNLSSSYHFLLYQKK